MTKKKSKPVPPRQQHADALSGPDTWVLPVETTSLQLPAVTSVCQQQSKLPKDTPSTTLQRPNETRDPQREYHAFPTLSRQAATRQSLSWPSKRLPMTALPPPSSIPDGISSPWTSSRESYLQLSLARLLEPESIAQQRQPILTAVAQEPLDSHLNNQHTASEAAVPYHIPLTAPGTPSVKSNVPQGVDVDVGRSASAVRLERQEQEDVGVCHSPEPVSTRTLLPSLAQEGPPELRRAEGARVSTAAAAGARVSVDIAQQCTSAQRRHERKLPVSISIIPNLFGARLDATAADVATGQLDTGVNLTCVRETKTRAVLFTILHCLSQALVNILIKQVVDVPKTKIAYYVAFGFMLGNMPEAFSLSNPFGPRHVQVDLGLRGMASLMSLMLKAEALRYLTVSDLALVNTLVPVCVMLLSWCFLGEGAGLAMWASVSLCLCGVVIVMRPAVFFKKWDADSTNARLIGFMYAFGSAVSLVIMIVLLRLTRNATSRFVGYNSGLTRTVLALSLAMVTGEFDQLLDGRFLATLVIMGNLSFCTICFLNKALQSESAAFVTTIKFSGDIMFSVILQMAFLDLYPDVWTLSGIALVVFSFVMIACGYNIVPSSWRRRRRRQTSGLPMHPLACADDEAAPFSAASLASPLFSAAASSPTP